MYDQTEEFQMEEMEPEDIIMQNRTDEHLLEAEITDIEWERILIHFTMRFSKAEEFVLDRLAVYLVSRNYRANARLKIDRIEGSLCFLTLNPTNPGYARCLQNGIYSIVVCQDDDILCSVTVNLHLASNLETKSRMLLHNSLNMGYNIAFAISEEDDSKPFLEIHAQDMKKKGIDKYNESDVSPASQEDPTLAETVKKKLVKQKNKILSGKRKHAVLRSVYEKGIRKYENKPGRKTVLFLSEQSETLGVNLQCIMKRMRARGLNQQFEIIASARNMVGQGGYSYSSWLNVMEKLSKADYIFVDDHVPFMDWLHLDPRQTVIQVWHAGAGYKSVGYSRWGRKGSPRAFSCHRQYDYAITPSKNIAFFFSEQFGINEEQVLPTGMPRMDSYIDPENRKRVTERLYEEFPICRGKKVILFAPTYRGMNRKAAHYPFELVDFDKLYQECGEEYIVLFKMHPWVSNPVPIREEYQDRFLDVGGYPNINDFFYISDLLITDYSSSVFEFSLMRKPMLFFAFDELQYAYSRGFHREYRPAAPGKICATFDEVLDAIRNKDFEFEKIEPYIQYHFDHIDSNATDRVIDWFLLGQMPEETVRKLEEIRQDNERLVRLDFSNLTLLDEEEDDEDE